MLLDWKNGVYGLKDGVGTKKELQGKKVKGRWELQ